MKNHAPTVLGILGLLCWTAPVTAWWQWYYHGLPDVRAQVAGTPNMWFYDYPPLSPTPSTVTPGMWFYQTLPYGPTRYWSLPAVSLGGVYLEQMQSPMGYRFTIRSSDPNLQGVQVAVEGGALVVRSRNIARSGIGQAGWSTQWVALPVDANLAEIRLSRGRGVLDIFIPRG